MLATLCEDTLAYLDLSISISIEGAIMAWTRLWIPAVLLTAPLAFAQNSTGNAITGGAKAEVIQRYEGSPLSKPEQVLIRDFTVGSDIVVDESMAARLHGPRLLGGSSEGQRTQSDIAKSIEDTFAKSFIKTLKKQQVEAARVSEDTGDTAAPTLVVTGDFLSINEGDKTKRVMIGFGRGGSDIKTHVLVSLVKQGHSTVIFEGNIDAKSGMQPGALATMGVGSLAVGAATHTVGDQGSTAQKDASRVGKLVATEVIEAMRSQKWIATPTNKQQASVVASNADSVAR
jgi:hypothetical protein